MKIRFLSILVIIIVGCKKEVEQSLEKTAAIFFKEVDSNKSGIHFSNELHHDNDLNIIEYLYYYNGGGVAIGDINNDGLEDIYFTANQTPDRLFLNLGNLRFKDITEEAGIQMDSTWSTGVAIQDVNNDGFLDIHVSKVGNYKKLKAHNLLYLNNGDSTFSETSEKFGLDFSGFSTQASFFDYDNDGDLDMYLMNHSVHTPRSYGKISFRKRVDSLSGDKLFENKLNEPEHRFIDVTTESGIYSSALGYGLAVKTSDINKDGFVDIYVGNDFHENDYIYLNQGNKTFKEVVENALTHGSRFTMGVDIADINNDLRPDIFTLDMMPYDKEVFLKSAGEDSDKVNHIKSNFGFEEQYARNTLQLNMGNTTFSDIALMTNTYASDWSWSTLIQDFDNDGHNDIFITNGIYKRPNDLNYINYLSNTDFSKYNETKQDEIERKLIEQMPTLNISNIMFRNKGNLDFEKLQEQSGFSPSYSNGAAYGDLDNDGDLDLVVNNINQKAQILENISPGENNYIFIDFKRDHAFNPTGAKVYLYSGRNNYYRELSSTRGFQSSSSHKVHFGLGSNGKVDSIKIEYLNGHGQTLYDVQPKQNLVIAANKDENNQAENKSLYSSIEYKTFPFTHIENEYLDYERERLIPEKLSAEGPALVKADFDSDGKEDIYIGGAKDQAPALFYKQENGSYIKDLDSDFNKDILYEDVDAISIDIDNDGDLDLLVLSGGNEQVEGSPFLEDRLYMNVGRRIFKRIKLPLLKLNGGSISSGDFNNDGREDLFIGNRSIPGGYGLSPFSYILKNNGKAGFGLVEKFRVGMVTDSQWADINNDGFLDLVVVGDWMPVTIYINQGDGTFKNETKSLGLDHSYGMWNTVLVEDIDGDGKNDIIAGNAGLNFKLKASKEKPIKLFLDDFDDNQQVDPIIFYSFFDQYVPFASKDKLAEQLPKLKKRFLDYEKFAKITNIHDLTEVKEDEVFEVRRVDELRSMVFMNKEDKFVGFPMPKQAQMSTIEDILVEKKETHNEIIFVGNFLDYTSEIGRSNANSGGVIKVDKTGMQKFSKYLPLPQGLNARRIEKIEKNKYLVVSNNDKSYIIETTDNQK